MVSLEEKLAYKDQINDNPKLTAFNNLLLGKSISQPISNGLNETDEIYYGALMAIQTNNNTQFENFLNKKNKSNPKKETPFVNDDFLIFCFIVGIMKFGSDRGWIKNIMS